MKYQTLGPTGLVVSHLALGTMTFGAETDEEGAYAQLDQFLSVGGNFVDTADVYAGGASEQIVGRWMRSRPASVVDNVVLVTKGRFATGGGPNDQGLSRRHLSRALDASLDRLNVDRIDLYLLHAFDPRTPLEETLTFLDDAVRAGKVNYVGLSNFTGWQMQRAADLAQFLHLTPPVALQQQYNLLAREVEWEVIPAAESCGIGLMPWSPLGGGWLTGKYGRDRPVGATRLGEDPGRGLEAYDRRSTVQRTWDVLDAVRSIARERDASMAQVALAWLIGRPGVTSVVLGARTTAQLTDNLGASDLVLTDDETQHLDVASDPMVGDYPYGRPGVEQRSRALPGDS